MDILQKDVFTEEMGMIFNRDDHVLPEQFNIFLKEIQRNGVYDEILDRWLNSTKDTRLPDLPENGRNGVLRIGVTGIIEPFNFIQNRELSVSTLNWPSVLPPLSARNRKYPP